MACLWNTIRRNRRKEWILSEIINKLQEWDDRALMTLKSML